MPFCLVTTTQVSLFTTTDGFECLFGQRPFRFSRGLIEIIVPLVRRIKKSHPS